MGVSDMEPTVNRCYGHGCGHFATGRRGAVWPLWFEDVIWDSCETSQSLFYCVVRILTQSGIKRLQILCLTIAIFFVILWPHT